jgi:hypothetical protein
MKRDGKYENIVIWKKKSHGRKTFQNGGAMYSLQSYWHLMSIKNDKIAKGRPLELFGKCAMLTHQWKKLFIC